MRFALWQNGGKGTYLQHKLFARGHTTPKTIEGIELLVIDCDWRWAHPRPELIRIAKENGAKVALYPHGGAPLVFAYDGLTEPDPNVDVRLEHGPGVIDVADLLGLELRQEPVGWLFSPTEPFKPVEQPRKVLFAPQHPNMETLSAQANGHDPGPKLNQGIYRQLLKLGFEVTVTMVGPAWKNGIWAHPGVEFVSNHEMMFQRSYELVRNSDVVVGAGSVAVCGVACGKPTVMFGQSNLADYVDGEYRWPDNHADYAELLRYPLDAEDSDLADLISRACEGDTGAAVWRSQFVGNDGTDTAVELLEQLVGNAPTSSRDVILEGVTARGTGIGG